MNRILSLLPTAAVLALSAASLSCGSDGLTLPAEGEPATIAAVSGSGQSGRVGTALAEPLVVRVTDTQARPVASAPVQFTITASGGELSPETATTDADGLASSQAVLGTQVGSQTVQAQVVGDAEPRDLVTTFSVTAVPASANALVAVSGNDQTAPVGAELPAPLVVSVTDGFGNPIAGVPITWTAVGGGSVTPASNVTGSDGRAAAERTLGSAAGAQSTQARSDGLAGSPLTFSHVATAGSAATVRKIAGDNQSGPAGSQLPTNLIVEVVDAAGNPITNRAVEWVIRSGGGSALPARSNTDLGGQAATSWSLGPTPGATNTLSAVVSGVGRAEFTATADAPPPPPPPTPSAGNSGAAANPASFTAGVGSSTITVSVRDADNDPIAGATVAFSASGSGNSFSSSTATTNSGGTATTTFSSAVAGQKTITATISANGGTITETATVDVQALPPPPPPPSEGNSSVAASPASFTAGQGSSMITVTVRDADNDPIAGASVAFSATGGGNSFSPANGTTNSAGMATATFSSTVAEQKTITATISANGGTISETVTVDVQAPSPPPNEAPVANPDSYSTPVNTTLPQPAPGVLGNDDDPDDGPGTLSASVEAGPTNGSLTLNSDGSFTYVPNTDFTGTDQFTYRASDGTNSSTATATITVGP